MQNTRKPLVKAEKCRKSKIIGFYNTGRKPLVTTLGDDYAGVLGTTGGPGNGISCYKKEDE